LSKTWRGILGGLLLALGGLCPTMQIQVAAQTSSTSLDPARLPEKHYMTKSTFFLPVNIDERSRSNIKEVQLWVKEGLRGQWTYADKLAPTQPGFNYRLMRDGEYWFAVVTVDQHDKRSPGDLSRELPGVIVVLDTQKPQVELKPMPSGPDGLCVRCTVSDANPDPEMTRFEYQTGDLNWHVLEHMEGKSDCYCVPAVARFTGMVRVSCADRAQNSAVCNFDLSKVQAAIKTPAIEDPKVVQAVNVEKQTPVQEQPAAVKPTSGKPKMQATVVKSEATDVLPAAKGPAQVERKHDAVVDCKHDAVVDCKHDVVCHEDAKLSVTRHMINHTHVCLEYRIEDEGQSGIGKVEVWITRDGGKSWDVLCGDPHHKSPVEFDLPGEGLYGIRLLVTNGRGFSADPPKPGDSPEYVIEVDTTRPRAELLSVKMGPASESACIDICWEASDKNFGSGPIDLYYGTTPQGPWTPMAKGVANTGSYRWFLPRGIGREAYVRLVATDMAGNSARCETEKPISLDDMSRPHATIVGVTTMPGGN
jgi:hypothetical protein